MADVAHIAGQERLHHQALDRADKESGSSLRVEVGVKFFPSFSFFDQTRQSLAITFYERLHYALGCRFFSTL
jgi:hypothetical protein